MGLLYSDNSARNTPTYNNNLKINACSGGIYKTYKESWFTRFNLKSEIAEVLFKSYDNEIKTSPDTYDEGHYTSVHKEPVIILQMVICGDMEVIAELIKEKDFNKYFEVSDNENNLESKGE